MPGCRLKHFEKPGPCYLKETVLPALALSVLFNVNEDMQINPHKKSWIESLYQFDDSSRSAVCIYLATFLNITSFDVISNLLKSKTNFLFALLLKRYFVSLPSSFFFCSVSAVCVPAKQNKGRQIAAPPGVFPES